MSLASRFRLVSFALLAVPGLAHPQGRALTIEDYYRVKTVGASHLSPDGRWVAFTVATRIEATGSIRT